MRTLSLHVRPATVSRRRAVAIPWTGRRTTVAPTRSGAVERSARRVRTVPDRPQVPACVQVPGSLLKLMLKFSVPVPRARLAKAAKRAASPVWAAAGAGSASARSSGRTEIRCGGIGATLSPCAPPEQHVRPVALGRAIVAAQRVVEQRHPAGARRAVWLARQRTSLAPADQHRRGGGGGGGGGARPPPPRPPPPPRAGAAAG